MLICIDFVLLHMYSNFSHPAQIKFDISKRPSVKLNSWKACHNCTYDVICVPLASGVLTLTITNPIWVTKTRLILQYSSDSTSKQYKGMLDALFKIYRTEGVSGLYKVSLQLCHKTLLM